MNSVDEPIPEISHKSKELIEESLKGILQRYNASKDRSEHQPLPKEYYDIVEERIKKHHIKE